MPEDINNCNDVAISSIHVDHDTHVEFVNYGKNGDVNADKPNPTFIAAAWFAQHTGGIAQSTTLEAVANVPSTAHLLGGAVIGANAAHGVIDHRLCVFGYQNLLVCDGAAMPANPGVNASRTIAALADHAMAQIAPAPVRPAGGPC